MLLLVLVKCPGIFLKDFKATENWGGGLCLNPSRDDGKQERTWGLGEIVFLGLCCICQRYLSTVQNGVTDTIGKDQSTAGCVHILGYLPHPSLCPHAVGIWQN